jgi:hypothetical protein
MIQLAHLAGWANSGMTIPRRLTLIWGVQGACCKTGVIR